MNPEAPAVSRRWRLQFRTHSIPSKTLDSDGIVCE